MRLASYDVDASSSAAAWAAWATSEAAAATVELALWPRQADATELALAAAELLARAGAGTPGNSQEVAAPCMPPGERTAPGMRDSTRHLSSHMAVFLHTMSQPAQACARPGSILQLEELNQALAPIVPGPFQSRNSGAGYSFCVCSFRAFSGGCLRNTSASPLPSRQIPERPGHQAATLGSCKKMKRIHSQNESGSHKKKEGVKW